MRISLIYSTMWWKTSVTLWTDSTLLHLSFLYRIVSGQLQVKARMEHNLFISYPCQTIVSLFILILTDTYDLNIVFYYYHYYFCYNPVCLNKDQQIFSFSLVPDTIH